MTTTTTTTATTTTTTITTLVQEAGSQGGNSVSDVWIPLLAAILGKRTPPQRVDYEIRARAERMVVGLDAEELWMWAKANPWHVDRELGDNGEGSVLGLFRRALQTAHQDQIRMAVRIERREQRSR